MKILSPSLLIFLATALLLSGCVSGNRKITEVLETLPKEIPRTANIPNVPFINQAAGHCGPATLTMVMNWNGKSVSVDEMTKQVYTPGMSGSFQLDMITASRRNSMMALPIEGFQSLIAEVAAGHPVIIFENQALSWAPQYHYAVVNGYDLDQKKIQMHSGPNPNQILNLSEFEKSWKLGDYWGLVVLNPGQLSASATEIQHVSAAASLEQLSKNQEAETAYQSILQRWPNSLGSLVGLGNIYFAKKKFNESARYLEQAVTAHPNSAIAWHNLTLAQHAAGKLKAAKVSMNRALALVPADQRETYHSGFIHIK